MQTVSLKKYYYPLFIKDTFVEVSDEVAEALLLMHREENLYCLTPTQARRIRARYLSGMAIQEIVASEGVSVSVVSESIRSGLKKLRTYFDKKKWREFEE
uniref:hypothetical protein n=1 Tax=Enterocloster clostridioformis TaxID=1531 RepID=UPI001C3E48F8|nr:hypothetical protein [Enterocloster clostridioformis]